MFQCLDCGKKYPYKRTLDNHLCKVKGPHIRFACKTCPKEFNREASLEFHARTCTGPPERNLKCYYAHCSDMFSNEQGRFAHASSKHGMTKSDLQFLGQFDELPKKKVESETEPPKVKVEKEEETPIVKVEKDEEPPSKKSKKEEQ